MKKAELVFIPAPAIGHLVSAVEFAKLLVDRDDRFSVTLLIMKLPAELPMLTDYFQPIIIIISCPTSSIPAWKPETACERCSEATPLDRVHSTCRAMDITEFGDSDADLLVPSFANSVPARVLPFMVVDKEGASTVFLNRTRRFREMKGILANTFMELESHAINTIANEQVKEIAHGLEHSGFRFLWSLRQPPPKGKIALPSDYANPEEVLPKGS
ncbi:UDP-glycosyltransferase 71A16 [Vitis vinifera]|uniref:UDP-glycosyltransferase 71A16 n=1 Tax=Vitis vinifera TaxID=29760 RepID=A0A438J3L3_VITVI|nr:UDP-glycosyltransferase 71A16 [Vitis vinifera]